MWKNTEILLNAIKQKTSFNIFITQEEDATVYKNKDENGNITTQDEYASPNRVLHKSVRVKASHGPKTTRWHK